MKTNEARGANGGKYKTKSLGKKILLKFCLFSSLNTWFKSKNFTLEKKNRFKKRIKIMFNFFNSYLELYAHLASTEPNFFIFGIWDAESWIFKIFSIPQNPPKFVMINIVFVYKFIFFKIYFHQKIPVFLKNHGFYQMAYSIWQSLKNHFKNYIHFCSKWTEIIDC